MTKKSYQILLTPKTHLRLKVQAAMLGLTLGEMINHMLEIHYPMPSIDAHLDFSRAVRLQEEEESGGHID